MTGGPKVSVVLPTYNRAHLLPNAVNSVLAQTYSDFELIIVDDGSGDETQAVISSFSDRRIRSFRHERNRGVPAARNTGIDKARGEYVAGLDDDIEYRPGALAALVERLDNATARVGFAYGWREDIYPTTQRTVAKVVDGDMWEDALAFTHPCGNVPMMVRTKVLAELGGYNESLQYREDADLIVRICERSYEVACVPQVLADVYCEHEGPRPENDVRRERDEVAEYMRAHAERFRSELDSRPLLYLRFAEEYMVYTNRRRQSAAYLVRSLRGRPLWPNIYECVKILVWRISPLSRLRERTRGILNRVPGIRV